MSTRHQLEPETRRHGAAAVAGNRRLLPAFLAVLIVAIATVSILLLVNHNGGTAAAKNTAAANKARPHPAAAAPAPTVSDSLSPVSQNSAETVAPAAGTGSTGAGDTSASGSSASGGTPASKPASSKYVKYKVKPGDNLWVIADWFHQKGYQPIYQWNQTTIGKDPSLIRPGQTLIVAVRS